MRCTEQVQQLIADVVTPGSTVVDATMGNGHDTLALARAVGETGAVWAFDVQQQAVRQTCERVAAAGLYDCCNLIHGCHSKMDQLLPAAVTRSRVQMVIFNLGYLPGGDKSVATTAETTRQALNCASRLLAAGGYLVVTAYTGHHGGADEAAGVAHFFGELAADPAWSILTRPVPQPPAPCLFVAVSSGHRLIVRKE